jgi:hypothetical protein
MNIKSTRIFIQNQSNLVKKIFFQYGILPGEPNFFRQFRLTLYDLKGIL